MSSQVCRFFMNGNCRYGDRCRYSHSVPRSDYGSGYSSSNPYVLNRSQPQDRQSYNEPKQNWKHNVSYNDIQELIEKIRDEAKQVEFEHLWPLTCLSVIREGANVPGWEDVSMEELRTAAYSAKLTGRFDDYVRFYQDLIQKAKESRSIFLRPGKRAEEAVRLMLEKRDKDDGKTASNFSFAQVPAFGGFSSTAASGASTVGAGSIFGGSPPPTVGSALGSTPFGSGAGNPTPGIFAMAAKGFASNVSQSSVLNDTEMETASESMFKNNTLGVSPLHQNIFGQVAQPTSLSSPGAPNPFGGAPSTTGSVFGGNTPTSSVFGGSTAQSVDVNAASPSVFGGALATSSAFGGTSASSPFSSSQGTSEVNFDDSVYTPMSELSESDLEQFRAATFTLSKLPLVPPPKELC